MEAGQEFGSYKLIARIGAGGMGEVWKAEDPRLKRTVAIKILPADSTENTESNARFMREARTAAQLYHPNIATIHSIEEHEGRPFIVMEFVEGEPLSRAIASGRLSEAEVAYIGKGVAEALAEAHAHGIVHRDIKPDNVVVSGQRVKVLDFGIAKKYQTESEASDEGSTFTDFRTQRGVILGTIQYMSPEQAMGKALDGRSDMFSLGVVLYEAATGRLPFKGETVTDTLTRIIRDDPPDLRASHPNLAQPLAGTIMRCLAKDREARFRNAAELAKALDDVFTSLKTGRRTADEIPTAVSVRHAESSTTSKTAAAGRSTPQTEKAIDRRGHGPWPWIFATILLVALSVAGTAWYLTRVLRPEEVASAAPPGPPPIPEDLGASPEPGSMPPDEIGAAESRDGQEGKPQGAFAGGPPPEPGGPAQAEPPDAAEGADPKEQAQALARRGEWLIRSGREGEGVEALRRAIELDPALVRAWLPVGVAALRRGRPEDAAKAFSAALRQREVLGPREIEVAMFGHAIASGDLGKMSEFCASAPFEREFMELRRLAHEAGAECGLPSGGTHPRRGPGPPGGAKPRPNH